MINLFHTSNQVNCVSNFQELISTYFHGEINAICWERKLVGDFSEIIKKIEIDENIVELGHEELRELNLGEQGQLAREILLNDMKLLKAHGASPVLNIISSYEREDSYPLFPTDVYSFHVDRSPIPTDTFLCTYHGEPSEILPNSQAEKKILIPEIRNELRKLHDVSDGVFEDFLSEYFFDLHYQAKNNAQLVNLGKGHLWKIAVDHPKSKVLPCLHRAPTEKEGENRLLLIC